MKSAVAHFISHGGDFEELALALYRWQRSQNPEYDRFCGSVQVSDWTGIPAVPAPLFRDLALTCFDPIQARVRFVTSGTSTGTQGIIRLADTDVYDQGALAHATRCLGTLPTRGVSLVPDSATSSLGHMCRHLVPALVNGLDPKHRIDPDPCMALIREEARHGEPLFVPATAFALADLLQHTGAPCPLPPGSIVMITGGFKGQRRVVSPQVLHAAVTRAFPQVQVVGEYGMSELASQLWAVPAHARFVPPPWMRVRAVHPWTGEAAETGILRFYDLANHQTVMAIETADVGTVHSDGTVDLQGRLPGAVLRGCSLRMEDARA